jgi:hypothetical protein
MMVPFHLSLLSLSSSPNLHSPRFILGLFRRRGGAEIGIGALTIYSGMRQDNDALRALGLTGGVGGASWIYGLSRDSARAISISAKANVVGNILTAPLTVYDVYRSVGAPGEHANRSWQENTYSAIVDSANLAGILYPQAALLAIGAEYDDSVPAPHPVRPGLS